MRAATVDLGGRRVLLVGTLRFTEGDGDPDIRALIATTWPDSCAPAPAPWYPCR